VTRKADFTDVYVQPDPRAYYETLGALDYEIPQHGSVVFDTVLDELRGEDVEPPVVLDVCCSYGVNAALLNHDLDLDEIEEHYATNPDKTREEMVALDRDWYGAKRRSDAVEVVGLDASAPAVDYAVDTDLLIDGVVADLEQHPLQSHDAKKLSSVDLITVTGGVGYVNERTFDQILDAVDDQPWVAALSLRWIDFDPIAETLDAHGLVTEKVEGFVVPQRRFADAAEKQYVVDRLGARGLGLSDVERSGQHGAELYLARPADDIATAPLAEVFTDLI
jgi:SAM-dependent methyltransferase